MLTKGQAFVEAGQDEYEERYRQRVMQNLAKRALKWASNSNSRSYGLHDFKT